MRFDLNDLGMVLNSAAGAVDRFGRQRALSDLGMSIQTGDYEGAAKQALASGDLNTGLSLVKLGQEQKKLTAQREADAAAFGSLSGGVTPAANVSTGGNGKRIYDEAIAAGAQPNEAALLASAAGAESNYNPSAVHDGGTGYGLFGHRLDRLDAMRKAAGAQTPNEQQQIAFALQELRSRPEGRMVATAKTPEELTRAQMFFERPRGFTPNAPERGDNYAGRLDLTRQYFPGQAQPVQIADASGAVPIGVNDTDINALMTKRANIERALSTPNLSDAARTRLNSLLKETDFMITRSDRQEERAARSADRQEMRSLRQEQFNANQQDREWRRQQKEEADAAKRAEAGKMTEGQARANMLEQSARQFHETLSDPKILSAGLGPRASANQISSNLPVIGSYVTSDAYKQFKAAGESFAQNILYLRSGASAPEAEVKRTAQEFTPQPGDGPERIEQLRRARETALKGALEAAQRRSGGSPATPASGGQSGPITKEAYDALPSGATYTAPDGVQRVKR